MELTACLFEQVIRTLRADVNAREQRRFPRVGLRARTTIYPDRIGLTDFEPIVVWVRDLSLQGIGLTCSAALLVDCTFEIRLTGRAGNTLKVRYAVVRSRPMGAVYSIGAELLEVIEAVDTKPNAHSRAAKPLATLAALTKIAGGR